MGRQHQGMDRPGVCQVPEGSGDHGKMEETGCEIICGVPTPAAVKGLMRWYDYNLAWGLPVYTRFDDHDCKLCS